MPQGGGGGGGGGEEIGKAAEYRDFSPNRPHSRGKREETSPNDSVIKGLKGQNSYQQEERTRNYVKGASETGKGVP